jgi:diacylglycerol kinase (ATP)
MSAANTYRTVLQPLTSRIGKNGDQGRRYISSGSARHQARLRMMKNMGNESERPAPRCLIIANPAAGLASRRLVADLGRACEQHGAAVATSWTRSRGHAARLARAAVRSPADGRLQVIVSVGGDGTTREVACGMMLGGARRDRHALLVIPAGTGNSTYRAHWGDVPWRVAVEAGLGDLTGRLRSLDLARIAESGRTVVLGAGAGLTAQVLESARDLQLAGRDLQLAGPGRLQAGLDRALPGYKPYPGRVTVDGTVLHEGPTLFANVGGGRYRAWQYQVLPHSILDDGLLDVCAAGTGIGVGFGEFQDLLRQGRHLTRPDVAYGRGRRVIIERTDGAPLCFEHDGELVADVGPRVTLQIMPRALPVLCAAEGTAP